jgi:hypothetical protein
MSNDMKLISRRAALLRGGVLIATVGVIGTGSALAAAKKKAKADKEDFYFQDTPDSSGKSCKGCINFSPKPTGQFGADSGDCALLEGDVCTHCYCQGWTDKRDAGAKRAGT